MAQLRTLEEGLRWTLQQATETQEAVHGARIVRQCAGDVFTVPAGWLHHVINMEDCCKVAFDYFEPHSFHLYADSWRQAAAKQTKSRQADDYSGLCRIAGDTGLQSSV